MVLGGLIFIMHGVKKVSHIQLNIYLIIWLKNLPYKASHLVPELPIVTTLPSTSNKFGTATVNSTNMQAIINAREEQVRAEAIEQVRNKPNFLQNFQPTVAPVIDDRMISCCVSTVCRVNGVKEHCKGKVIANADEYNNIVTVKWDDNNDGTWSNIELSEQKFKKFVYNGWFIEHVPKYFNIFNYKFT